MNGRWVEIEFDCLPLRTVTRVDAPLDASPRYREFVLRVKAAIEKHGRHNTYYLHHAMCRYHFTNDPDRGMVQMGFEGTVLTDAEDARTRHCDLAVGLEKETCAWLTEPIVHWLEDSVRQAVLVEFDRYIAAGDLTKAKERIARVQAESDAVEGYLGMYL